MLPLNLAKLHTRYDAFVFSKSILQSQPLSNTHRIFNLLQGIVAFTFSEHDVARMEKQQLGEGSRSKGVIGEVFEVYLIYPLI